MENFNAIHSFQHQVAVELLGPVPEIVLWYLLTMVFDAVLSLDTVASFPRFHTTTGTWVIMSHFPPDTVMRGVTHEAAATPQVVSNGTRTRILHAL